MDSTIKQILEVVIVVVALFAVVLLVAYLTRGAESDSADDQGAITQGINSVVDSTFNKADDAMGNTETE